MKLITERTMILGVVARWDEQYRHYLAGDKTEISKKLSALDLKTATAADVDGIIGNQSWTLPPACSECGRSAPVVIEVGQKPDYDSQTVWLCEPCLIRGYRTMEKFWEAR